MPNRPDNPNQKDPRRLPTVKAVIFDMDGVLVDSIPVHFEAWKRAVRMHGGRYSLSHFNRQHGKSNIDIAKSIRKEFKLEVEPWKLGHDKHIISYKMLPKAGLFPGTTRVLAALRKRGMRLGLATSSNRATLASVWKRHSLGKHIQAKACADDVRKAKPAPDLFLLCARKLRINPASCVVVEDSYLGIEAAKRGGMMAVGVTNTYPKKKLAGADMVISSLQELPALVKAGIRRKCAAGSRTRMQADRAKPVNVRKP